MDQQAILKELEAHTGTQFDSRLVDAFCRIVKRQGKGVIVNSARDASIQHVQIIPGVKEAVWNVAPNLLLPVISWTD
jgi:HD-GYP domain-containing protein (c-di-GMP phosphodiesterase class II)